MQTLLQDLRYAVRMMLKHRGFSAIAILTLALSIGANTAIFSVVNGVLLQALPFKDSQRLVMVWETLPKSSVFENTPAPAMLARWRERSSVFEGLATWTTISFNLTGDGNPERVAGLRASANLFPLLGVNPALGRAFSAAEDQPGNHRVAVISHDLWQRSFGGDANLTDKSLLLNGQRYAVVGVMPRGFQFYFSKIDVWVPIAFTPQEAQDWNRILWVIGRLKPNISQQQAQAQLEIITTEGKPDSTVGVNVVPLHKQLVGDLRSGLLIILAATGFVLLIVCANVANMMLARAAARQKEIAVRLAIGAGRLRLVRQLLTESLLLAGVGGLAGVLVAYWGVPLLVSLLPGKLSDFGEITVNRLVLGFTALVSLITGIVFGLLPALQATRLNLITALKEGGRDSSVSSRGLLRSLLVVAEIALALILLIGAGLMLRSFQRLYEVDLGFKSENLLALQVPLTSDKYKDPQKRIAFWDELLLRLESLPGVESSGAITGLPIRSSAYGGFFIPEGRPNSQGTLAYHRTINPSYFQTMGIPLLKGRYFDQKDVLNSELVIIISENLARAFWPNEDPVGKRMQWGGGSYWKVVGVVKDVRLAQTAKPGPHVYLPYRQREGMSPEDLVIRTKSDPAGLIASVREQVRAIDPNQPISNISTMDQLLWRSLAQRRFNFTLLAIFAALALLLALLGIYGVLSYVVAHSTREIGIRVALGAQPRDVLKLIVGQGLGLALIGIGLGIGGAFGLTRLMKSLLFGVTATDPLTFLSVSVVLVVMALLACYVPARRATKVDPLVALRHE
jgi:putative ABC transport system permease protein